MLQWQESYSIGIELIDVQHKHLFNLANSALDLMTNDTSFNKSEQIIQLINDLLQYTKFHFLSEESYMLKIDFPLYESHKKEHDAFIQKITNIDLTTISSDQYTHIHNLVTFLLNWIITHIFEKDNLIVKSII